MFLYSYLQSSSKKMYLSQVFVDVLLSCFDCLVVIFSFFFFFLFFSFFLFFFFSFFLFFFFSFFLFFSFSFFFLFFFFSFFLFFFFSFFLFFFFSFSVVTHEYNTYFGSVVPFRSEYENHGIPIMVLNVHYHHSFCTQCQLCHTD